jgi:hypothetical protein
MATRIEACNMLQKYKEIFYGGLFGFFGFGAAVLDTFMDARMEGLSFLDETVQHRPMLFYRAVFILFGLALGWLLWQKNKREREFRDLSEILKRFREEYGGPAILMHAKLQVLLTREDLHLSDEAEQLVQFVYQQSQDLQSLVKNKLPSW